MRTKIAKKCLEIIFRMEIGKTFVGMRYLEEIFKQEIKANGRRTVGIKLANDIKT